MLAAIGLAVLLHAMLAMVLVNPPGLLRAAAVPPPPHETTIDIQNDVPAAGDAPVGGTQQESRAAPPNAAPLPSGQPAAASPDLPSAKDGELAPPAAGQEQVQTPPMPAALPPQSTPTPQQQTSQPETQDSTPRISLSDAGDEGEESGGSAQQPAKPDPKMHNKLPRYPTAAALAGQSGQVDMFVHVMPDGTASQIVVANSSGSATLDAAALRAVRTWHFRAAQSHGAPIASDVPVHLNFVLHGTDRW